MILFLGDSFTWGQGLYIEKWISEGASISQINDATPVEYTAENLDYLDDVVRKKLHYPNIVSQYLNRPYATKWGNGGSNEDIIHILEHSVNASIQISGLELVVIQFTHVFRDELFEKLIEDIPYDDFLIIYVKLLMNKIRNAIDKVTNPNNREIPFLVMSWIDDVGVVLKNHYADQFIEFKYNNEEYLSIEKLALNKDLNLSKKFYVADAHLTKEGHEIIAKGVIDKIQSLEIKFTYKDFY